MTARWHRVCSFPDMKIKHGMERFVVRSVSALAVLLAITLGSVTSFAQANTVANKAADVKLTAHEKQMIDAFHAHVRDYLKQRDRVSKKLPKLSKEATPEQINAYQNSFVDALRAMRAGTMPGYIFRPEFTEYVRTTILTEFPARDRVEIKQTILEADTKGIPLKINYPYPETKELTQIPPTLLLKLPQLPKQVKYRFVGRHMLLVDTDNGLIVDYTLNALP
jgi:ABC-type transporter MlaC component